VKRGRAAEAEAALTTIDAVMRKDSHTDKGWHANVLTRLGAARLARRAYRGAERALLESNGMRPELEKVGRFGIENTERLAALYDEWNRLEPGRYATQAANWRALRQQK
jgi:hypothetical protein